MCGSKWIVIGRPPLAGEDGDEDGDKDGDEDRDEFINHFFSDRRLFTGDFAVEDARSAPWKYEALYLAPGTAL